MTLRGFAFQTAVAVLLWLLPTGVEAQTPPWPASPPPSQSDPVRTASHVSSITALPPILKPADSQNPDRPPDARDGVFQKLIFSSTWLDAGTRNGFGMVDLELQTVLAFPFPSRQSPITVTPAFAVHYLDGPVVSDLPPRLYDAGVELRWWKRLTPRFGIDLEVAPGVFSDFEQSTGEAIRIPGHVVGMLDWTPNAKILFGVAYLDREDVPILPVGGLLWYPHKDLKIELAVPRPRIARRIYWQGAFTDDVQDWAYVAGEFGGGTWAIRRDDGANDLFTYRDYRLILGLQRKAIRGLDANLELGYVFSRAIEYSAGSPDVHPSDTLMLRLGFTY